jgi:UDP:flavonoid glycosyltransferase YjiC (YdhE family)
MTATAPARLRLDLLAPPMAGHLHPILGLAQSLVRDYDVRVLSSEGAQREIAAAGLPGRVLLPGRDAEVRAIVEPAHAVGSHPLRLHRQLRANLTLLGALQDDLRRVWQEDGPPALALADFTLPVVGAVAREFAVPWWTTHPSPCVIETPDGPPAYLGGWSPGRGVAARVRDALGRTTVRFAKRLAHRLHRDTMRQLGLDAMYRPDGSEAVYSPDRIFALGLEALEFPRRWPAAVEFVGPVRYTPPGLAPAPPFVAGRRHVLVTIGTHLPWMKDTMAAAAEVMARALPDIEVHFSDGRADRVASALAEPAGRGGPADRPANFHRLPYVSYARDLPRYALVVHHGGAGVMYHTLAAGLPALVLPLDYDQFDHAARLDAAGVARRLREPGMLAAAVRAALDDTAFQAASRRFVPALAVSDAGSAVTARVRELLATSGRPAARPAR